MRYRSANISETIENTDIVNVNLKQISKLEEIMCVLHNSAII